MALTSADERARARRKESKMRSIIRQAAARGIVPLGVAAALVAALAPRSAEAIPAFARQFNANCKMCHQPVPPRLNNFGLVFKRVGYRMPDTDEQDRFVLKDKPSKSLLEDFSAIADFRGETETGQPAAFMLDEAELMGAGVAGKHLSYAAQVAWEDGEFDLEAIEGHLLFGRPTANVTVRFGLLAPLAWDKFGHQSLTIAQPLLPHNRVAVGEFDGYRLHTDMPGVEVGFNLNRLGAEGGTLRSTFFTVGVFNGLAQEDGILSAFDENNDFKDVMLQVTQLWGDSHSIGALWYRGKVTGIGEEPFDDRLDRWVVFGNYRLPTGTDLVAGFGWGRDATTREDVGTVKSRSWYAEIDQRLSERAVAVVRWDSFDPDRAVSAVVRSGPTVGMTYQLVDNLLLSAEYRGIKQADEDREQQFTLRAKVLY